MSTGRGEASWSHSNSSLPKSKHFTESLISWRDESTAVTICHVLKLNSMIIHWERFSKYATHWLKLCTVEMINLLCRNFPFAPFTTTQILADISESQQLSSFLSLAFPWLDIYPALDWLKERKYSSILHSLPIPCSPCLFQLRTLPLGLPGKRSKSLKHLVWPHKGHKFRIHGISGRMKRL